MEVYILGHLCNINKRHFPQLCCFLAISLGYMYLNIILLYFLTGLVYLMGLSKETRYTDCLNQYDNTIWAWNEFLSDLRFSGLSQCYCYHEYWHSMLGLYLFFFLMTKVAPIYNYQNETHQLPQANQLFAWGLFHWDIYMCAKSICKFHLL